MTKQPDPWNSNDPAAREARLGTKPIEAEYGETMRDLAARLDHALNGAERPKKTGFVLMIFPFGDKPGRCNYMSNAARDEVKVLLREQLAYFDGMPETAPGGRQ